MDKDTNMELDMTMVTVTVIGTDMNTDIDTVMEMNINTDLIMDMNKDLDMDMDIDMYTDMSIGTGNRLKHRNSNIFFLFAEFCVSRHRNYKLYVKQ